MLVDTIFDKPLLEKPKMERKKQNYCKIKRFLKKILCNLNPSPYILDEKKSLRWNGGWVEQHVPFHVCIGGQGKGMKWLGLDKIINY